MLGRTQETEWLPGEFDLEGQNSGVRMEVDVEERLVRSNEYDPKKRNQIQGSAVQEL